MSAPNPYGGHSPQQPVPNPSANTQPYGHAPQSAPYGAPTTTQPGYPGGGAQPPAQPKGLAIASMVVGIASLVLCATIFGGIVGGIVAVVLGIIALKKAQSKAMSITGIATGGLAFLIAVIIFVSSMFFFGAALDSISSPSQTSEQVVEETQDAAPEETEETEAAPEEEPEETEPEAAEPEWTTVLELSGNADRQSDTIELTGGNVRITYEFEDSTGHDMVFAAIYLLDEGVDLMTDGGIPDVMISEAGDGETILRRGAGEYYLRVSAANTNYTVIVEEQR